MSMSRVPCSKSDFSMGIASPELDQCFNRMRARFCGLACEELAGPALFCFCVPNLLHENVSNIMPIRDECQRGLSVLFRSFEIRRGAIQVGPGKTHQKFRLAPPWIERIDRRRLVTSDDLETFLVRVHCFGLAAPAFGGNIPINGTENPEE